MENTRIESKHIKIDETILYLSSRNLDSTSALSILVAFGETLIQRNPLISPKIFLNIYINLKGLDYNKLKTTLTHASSNTYLESLGLLEVLYTSFSTTEFSVDYFEKVIEIIDHLKNNDLFEN